MDFTVKKRKSPVSYNKEAYHLAYKFAGEAMKEFGTFVKAIVLFGSAGKKKAHDVDILIIIDDATFILSPEVVETYRIAVERLIAKTSMKIHVTTMKFTRFWEYIKVGDPIAINMLRSGVAIIDTGFFFPMQLLLFQGRIRPTAESINSYMSRAQPTLHNAKWHIMQATIDLYWAVIDSAHAALMKKGVMPPQPKDVAKAINDNLVKHRHVPISCVRTMHKFYTLSKQILHRELKGITGQQFDKLYREAQRFVDNMRKYVFEKD